MTDVISETVRPETIQKRLQDARVDLGGMNLKMSGYNSYQGFPYYELKDIQPAIDRVLQAHDLSYIFLLEDGVATLTIVGTRPDDTGEIVFKFPVPLGITKNEKANKCQEIGSVITYTRRYALYIAFSICAPDEVDAADNSGGASPPPASVSPAGVSTATSTQQQNTQRPPLTPEMAEQKLNEFLNKPRDEEKARKWAWAIEKNESYDPNFKFHMLSMIDNAYETDYAAKLYKKVKDGA